MKKIFLLIGVFVYFIEGYSQCDLNKYFYNAINQFPSLPNLEWVINYENSFNIQNRHIEIEAYSKKCDTIFHVLVTIFPNQDTTYYMREFLKSVKGMDTIYHTGYDSNFIPIFKYKIAKLNPDSLIFDFGENKYNVNGLLVR